MEQQVNKNAYIFSKYVSLDRWSSYYYQLREVLNLSPSSILEVGVGDKVFGNYIINNTDIDYKNLDIASDLKPDILGSVDQMPIESSSFELVCAFEVLEHLPFDLFEKSLREIARVSSKYAVLSLPHFGPPIKFLLKVPFLSEIKMSCKVFTPKKHAFNGQHYWEIGKKGFRASKMKKTLKKYFILIKDFIPFENQYHHFYVLQKK
jgi:ubiquinone/menaquinone biosynthesis C-methylase UbiE